MADLLREYVREVISELHIDPKMKAVVMGRAGAETMQNVARAKGLFLRWVLERGVEEPTSEMEEYAKSAFTHYLKRYGPEVAPHALVQLLDKKYNGQHVGNKSDVPTRGGGRKGRSSEREDDPTAPGVVQSGRAIRRSQG